MKILLIDDRPQVRNFIEDIVYDNEEKFGCELVICKDLEMADQKWYAYKDDIRIIILDIMMTAVSLDDKLRKLTQFGQIAGWIWLWHHINNDDPKCTALAQKKVIVFSGYLEDFAAYIDKLPEGNEKRYAESLTKISKGSQEPELQIRKALYEALGQ